MRADGSAALITGGILGAALFGVRGAFAGMALGAIASWLARRHATAADSEDLLHNVFPMMDRQGYILWGLDHGWRWMPKWGGQLLARFWNPVVCWWRGEHDWVQEGWDDDGPQVCTHCDARMP